MKHGIYLDNGMVTQPSDKAIAAMIPFLREKWGTPSAPHQRGQELFPAIQDAYEKIYDLVGAKASETIVMTSSGAEAVNHLFLSTYQNVTLPTGKNHFLTSTLDEAPALMSIGRLEQMHCVGKMIQANKEGKITLEAVTEALTPRTALISLSWANGLTGVVNPVAEIGRLCKQRGILFHLEASHILGKVFYEIDEINAHYISFGGDHLHAPPGTGGLYIRDGVKCASFIVGGIEQAGHRAGNLNVAGLVGLGQASKEMLESRDLVCTEIARLRNLFETRLLEKISEAKVFFPEQERLPNISCVAFPGISNELMLFALNRRHLFASIGGGNFQQIGLVLIGCGVSEVLAHSALSFNLSRDTTEEEIERAVEIIAEEVTKLRKISHQFIQKAV